MQELPDRLSHDMLSMTDIKVRLLIFAVCLNIVHYGVSTSFLSS